MPALDLKEEYKKHCAHFNVKVNSIINQLPESGSLTELDLTNTLVGANGVKPLMELVKQIPELHTLILKGQRINSEVMQHVAEALKGHPGLTTLDISGNHCPLAGPTLVELTKKNPKLVTLNIEGCDIKPLFVKLIENQLGKNRKGSGSEPQTADEGNPNSGFKAFGGEGDEEDPFAKSPADPFVSTPSDTPFGGAAMDDSHLRPGSSARRDKRRPTVCSEIWNDKDIDEFVPPEIDKAPEAIQWLCERLEHIHLFSHLDDRELMMAVKAMEEKRFGMGDLIKQQGDEGDDHYYIIYAGECECIVDETVTSMKKGDGFGEVQLLYHQDETATVKVTSSECIVFGIARETYRRIVAKASKAKRAKYEGFLQKVNFLKGMKRSEILQLADALKSVKCKPGELIIQYGEEGMWFHIIVEGTVEVIGRDPDGNPIKVCEFKEGDCVGELEFINNHKCVADVRAVGETRTAKMNRRHFEMCMGPVVDVLKRTADTSTVYEYYRQTQEGDKKPDAEKSPEAAQEEEEDPFATSTEPQELMPQTSARGIRRRQTVSAEVITDQDIESFKPNVIEKDDRTREFIAAALERLPLFCHLEDFELNQLAMAMEKMTYEKDEVVIEAGSEGDMFHLLYSGEVIGSAPEEPAVELKAGQHFGEVVLMYAQPYPLTYTAASHEVVTYTLDRSTYKHIMQKASMKKRVMYEDFLKRVGFLKTLSPQETLQLADALKPASYRDGEHLIRYGDDGTWFYIIVEGVVEVWGRDADRKEKKVCEFTVGDCVGELEFINNHKCVADVRAKGNVRTAKMHRHHFEMCMGPIVDILKRQAGESHVYEYYRQTLAGQNAPLEAGKEGEAK